MMKMNFKQIISLVLTLIILSTVVCIPYTAATEKMPDLLIGDADGDGVITIMDATAVALHLAKKSQLDEIHQQTAKTDFTTDVLSVIDATIIQQKVADIKNKDTGEVGLPAFKYVKGEYVPALQEYQKALDTIIEKYNISGVAYVTRNGRVMCQSATGMQNTEKGIEMTMDTLFPIGSISKQFCATAVLMLQDQGKLSVNDTIDKYFPEYKYASQITIHHLLSMRSGIYDYLNDNPDAVELFSNTDDIITLGNHFELHPLIQEDIVSTYQRPKIDEYEEYLFIVFKMLHYDNDRLNNEHISMVMGKDYVLTFQEAEGDVFSDLRERLEHGKGRIRGVGADYLMFAILDAVVDNYFSVIEYLSNKVELLEDKLFDKKEHPDIAEEIQQLKKEILKIRKAVVPLREVVNRLEKIDYTIIEERTNKYIRDLYDHIIQVNESVEIYREMIWSLMDMYMTTISNKMNEVMKVLTIMASIFIPLTFMAGIYGMNFDHMPELHLRYGYYYLWGLMILVFLGLLWYFKRKKWI